MSSDQPGEHAPPPTVYKIAQWLPVRRELFDECGKCGEPITGKAFMWGVSMAWHESCIFPTATPSGSRDGSDA